MFQHLPAPLASELRANRRTWLVTGAAGFIGSNLVETLLAAGQRVVGLDNFSTGYQRNIDEAAAGDGSARLSMVTADIRDRAACAAAVEGADVVLHQAALGSVPRSLAEPLASHDTNGHDPRNGGVHVAGAGARPRRRSSRRYLGVRRRAL